MAVSIEKQWLIGAASELATARKWLETNLPARTWKLELLGLETDGAAIGGARISVRCIFESSADSEIFSKGYLKVDPAPTSVQAPETKADHAFADSAHRILNTADPVSAGKLHFINLEAVKAHFGDQWPRLSERAETLVRRTIERRLSPTDVYRKTSDLNFIVVFGNLAQHEAEIKCAIIAEEITRLLVGDEMGGGKLTPKALTIQIDDKSKLQASGSPEDIIHTIESKMEVERIRRDAPQREEHTASSDPLAGIKFAYQPIWDVGRSAVTNYYLVPMRAEADGRLRYGEAEIPELADPEIRKRFDLLVLDHVIGDLLALQKQGRRLLISFPVHFESVSSGSRRNEVLSRWRSLPPEYRKLGVIEIAGAPVGVPQGRIAEIVAHLRLECRGVLARTGLTAPTLGNFTDTGLTAIGAEIGGWGQSEERLMSAFEGFVVNATKARLSTYICGLRSFSLTIAAIGAGFNYVSGDPISSIGDKPSEAYRMNLADLYQMKTRSILNDTNKK